MRNYKKTQTMLKNYEFNNVFENGKHYSGKYIYIFILKNDKDFNNVGFIASKKNGKAVSRNRIKRLLRNAYYKNINNLGYSKDLILGIKKSIKIDNLKSYEIEEDFKNIIKQIKS